MGWVHAIKCLFLTIKAEVLWFWHTVFPGRIADSKDSKDDVSWVWEFNFCTQNIKYVAEKHWTHQWFQPKSFLRMHVCDFKIPPTDTQIKLCAKRQRLWHNVQNQIILPAYMAEPQHFTIKQILKWICGSAKRPCHSSVAPSPLTVLKEERLASNH